MNIRKFKVATGTYSHFGVKYVKDEVVSSYADLASIFRCKFTEVDASTADSHITSGAVLAGAPCDDKCVVRVGDGVYRVHDGKTWASQETSLDGAVDCFRMLTARATKPAPLVFDGKPSGVSKKAVEAVVEAVAQGDEAEDDDEPPVEADDEPEEAPEEAEEAEEEQEKPRKKKKVRVEEDEEDIPPRKRKKAKKNQL